MNDGATGCMHNRICVYICENMHSSDFLFVCSSDEMSFFVAVNRQHNKSELAIANAQNIKQFDTTVLNITMSKTAVVCLFA